jgi:hypothetical protein
MPEPYRPLTFMPSALELIRKQLEDPETPREQREVLERYWVNNHPDQPLPKEEK